MRQPQRPASRADLLAGEALETPLPGRLLVLLSRLHRSEQADMSRQGPAA